MRQSYLQIFRDGGLEYGDSAVLDGHVGAQIASQLFEQKIMETFANSLTLLNHLETAEPVFVSLTQIRMKGRTMALPQSHLHNGYRSEQFDRDVILCPDMLIENLTEGYPYPSTLLPIVNAAWQATGLERTPYVPMLWKL